MLWFYYVVVIIILLFISFMLMFYDWKWVWNFYRYRKLPLIKMTPIVGVGLDLLKHREEELFGYLLQKKEEMKSDLVCGHVLGNPYVFLFAPEDVEVLFSNLQHLTKGFEYKFLIPWFRQGLVMSTGSHWHRKRKLWLSTFHNSVLKNYLSIMNEKTRKLTKILIDDSIRNGFVGIEEDLSSFAFDIVMETKIGLTNYFPNDQKQEFLQALTKAGKIVLQRVYTFWMQNETLFRLTPTGRQFSGHIELVHNFCKSVIQMKKTDMKNRNPQWNFENDGNKRSSPFLEHVLKIQHCSKDLTDEDVVDELQNLFHAACHSISIAGMWTLFLLAIHPEVQKKLREEIEKYWKDGDLVVTTADLNQMQYMDMVIQESLRLYPVFPFISRFLTTDLQLNKYTIPAGTNVVVSPYIIHRSTALYPDPERFDPERFSPQVIKHKHPYSFLSWSAGYRSCMGKKFALLELKMILCHIIRKSVVTTTLQRKDVKMKPQFVARSTPKIYLKFETI